MIVSSIAIKGKSPLERENKGADKGQGLGAHHGGSLPPADYFGVHWNDDQSTYPLSGGGQPAVIGHHACSGERVSRGVWVTYPTHSSYFPMAKLPSPDTMLPHYMCTSLTYRMLSIISELHMISLILHESFHYNFACSTNEHHSFLFIHSIRC